MQFVYFLATAFALFGVSFGQPSLSVTTATIAELSSAGTALVTAAGTGGSGTVTYSIHAQDPAGWYVIDSSTGAITVATGQTIDAETTGAKTITVHGVDTAPATGTTTITVTITDKNDNSPTFATTTGTLTANANAGAAVGTFAATDADAAAPNNAIASYALGDNCDTYFAVAQATGVVTIKTGGTGPAQQCGTFTIKATDSGTDPSALTGTGTISLNIGSSTCSSANDYTDLCASGSASVTFSLMAMVLGLLTNLMK